MSGMKTALGMYAGILLMVTCGSLLGADMAQARELTQQERVEIQDVANRAWPDSRCHGHVNIVWAHNLDGMVPSATLHDGAYMVAGYAFGTINGSCDAGVRSDLDPQEACTTAVHEAGHLAGLEHGNGMAIMGDAEGVTAVDYVWPACRGMIWMPVEDAEGWLSFHTSAWTHVHCKRAGSARFTCVTTRHRPHGKLVRKVWRVWATDDNGDYRKAKIR